MSEDRLIVAETAPGVTRVTLNRPDVHNAFDDALLQDLCAAISAAEQDDRTRLMVLKGSGKSFCAGADLTWMRRAADSQQEFEFRKSVALDDSIARVLQFRAVLLRRRSSGCLA